jgi:hypothetical protein
VTVLLALALIQSAAGSISGLIVESRTGAPLAAVLVKVESTGQQAFSDEEGRFELIAVPAGPQTLLVSVVGYGLVRRDITITAGDTAAITIPVAEGASTYVEEVTVGASLFRQAEAGIASQAVLGGRDLLALRGVMADDPFRAVQVLPTVATGDDFRAEFAVRGLGPAHTGIALDGVDSPLLFHTVRGVDDSGSLALINTDILESASLMSGAYPQRAGAHLGSRLDFTTRDGARDRLHGRALVSATAATTVWEGPLGRSRRGSWLAAFRQSYIDWLIRQIDPETAGTFGFTDTQARATYDLSPRQSVTATFIAGRSTFTENEENPGINELDTARNRTFIGNLQWRFTPSTRWSITQQVYAVDARYENRTTSGGVREEGGDSDLTWRGTLAVVPGERHTIEFGGQAQSFRSERADRTFLADRVITNLDVTDRFGAGAAWAHYRWSVSPSMLVSPGFRVERMGAASSTVGSPWLLAEWQATPATRFRASAGVQHQAPTFDQQITVPAIVRLAPERASTIDLGVERRIGEAWRIALGGYYRRESDRLRYRSSEFRLSSGGAIIRPQSPFWFNSMTGDARGAELTVEHRRANGVSGWFSYGWGRNELHDAATDERFVSDFDQTHMVNAYALYRTSGRLSLSSRLRYGSNFPLAGYYQYVNGAYYLGTARNTERLPYYLRVDLRGDWAFTYRRSRLTLFVEIVNALARVNYRPGDQSITLTGMIRDPIETLFPFLPSAGLLIEF